MYSACVIGRAVLLVAVALLVQHAAGDCNVVIAQIKTSAWGIVPAYTEWSVQITASTSQVTSLSLQLISQGHIDQIWEVDQQNTGYYTLPQYVTSSGGIKAKGSYTFGYIIESIIPATISVQSITCAGGAPTITPTTTAISTTAIPSTQIPTTTLKVSTTTRIPTTTTTTTTTKAPTTTTTTTTTTKAPTTTQKPTTTTTSVPTTTTTTTTKATTTTTTTTKATTTTTTKAPTTTTTTTTTTTKAPTTTTTTTKAPTTSAPTTAPTTSAPTTPITTTTSTPTRSASAPTYDKTCDVVIIIDNYIARTNPTSIDTLRQKYMSYFADIDYFYQKNFNLKMNLLYMYLEEGASSFTDTTDAGELLDSFRSALLGGFFGSGVPASACVYHLVTGRDVPGIGGTTYIGTACSDIKYNVGFSVDVQSQEESTDVVRTMIHELGHTFGGMHSDDYAANPLYSCNPATGNPDRVLRDYQYISPSLFISDCASTTMRNSFASFNCLWQSAPATGLPSITFYDTTNFAGNSNLIYARVGVAGVCYNIVYPHANTASSFRLEGDVSGVRLYANGDCTGDMYDFSSTTFAASLGGADKMAVSFQFFE